MNHHTRRKQHAISYHMHTFILPVAGYGLDHIKLIRLDSLDRCYTEYLYFDRIRF